MKMTTKVRRTPTSRAVRQALAWSVPCLALGATGTTLAEEAGSETTVLESVVVEGAGFSLPTEETGQYAPTDSQTATGLTLSARETPQSLSVVTNQQIEDFNLDSANKALEATPGVTVEKVETDRTYYTSRGFDIQNFQIDGLGAPFAYGNVQGDIDTAVYDRIEVIRGANGLMSGSGSPSATVNFIRKRPTPEAQAEVELSAGSWNRRRVEGDVSGPITEDKRIRGRLVVAGEQGESYLDRYERDRYVAYGVVEADLTDNTILTAGHTWQQNNADSPLWGALPLYYTDGTQTDYDRSTATSSNWAYWDNQDRRTFVELEHHFTNGWQTRAAINRVETEADAKLFYMYGTPDPSTGRGLYSYPSRYDYDNEQWIADVQAKGPFDLLGRTHELVAGVNWTRSETDDISHYGEDIGTPLPPLEQWDGNYPEPDFTGGTGGSEFTDRETAVYSAARLNLNERTTAILGTRATWLDNTGETYGTTRETSYDAELTPYAGLVYDLNDQLSAYASYTEIFEPQTEVDINRQRLDPIDGVNYEVGLKAELLDKRLNTSFAVFHTEQDNVAEPAGTIPGTVDTYYRGADGITSQGIELTAAGEILPGWRAMAGYTYVDIENADGERARSFIPKQMLRASTTYRLPFLPKLTVGGQLRWQSDISREQTSADGTTRQDAYTVVDLMARYEVNNQVDVTLNLNNVTDEKYLTSLQWDQGYYGAPRNAMLSVNWRY
ncbi:TonB-dependent siderophore receptor [Guyparkeria hydrothermalis]|uniref:TonB-dependent siderophore receptor n=1 Tax=Guyparkeria hydrothermalis TaxID=923 RepID=UPI0020207E46|nr:TonB-dependent siderophore receptor [Guyparkeria hydrothermalis]MCL7744388.1 TonB-dependent siderophore receptor [Guyparkeria hydrothermalis]